MEILLKINNNLINYYNNNNLIENYNVIGKTENTSIIKIDLYNYQKLLKYEIQQLYHKVNLDILEIVTFNNASWKDGLNNFDEKTGDDIIYNLETEVENCIFEIENEYYDKDELQTRKSLRA